MDDRLTLDRLYAAVERHIGEHLPGLQTIATWPDIDERTPVRLPAAFLELAEIEPGTYDGTGKTTMVCKFEVRLVVGAEQPLHKHQAAQLVAQLAVLLRAQYWGLEDVGPAEFVQAVPDWTKPELDGYTVWLVEWTQAIQLGEEEWPWSDQPPSYLQIDLSDGGVDVLAGMA